MKELVLPVPKMVSATYVVPVPTPMGTAEARQKASTAVETRLTGPLRTLTAEWLAKGVVKVGSKQPVRRHPGCWTGSCSALRNSGSSSPVRARSSGSVPRSEHR